SLGRVQSRMETAQRQSLETMERFEVGQLRAGDAGRRRQPVVAPAILAGTLSAAAVVAVAWALGLFAFPVPRPPPPPATAESAPPARKRAAGPSSQAAMLHALALSQVRRGEAALEQGNTDDALASFRAALENEPTIAVAFRGLGMAYAMQGHDAEALQAYDKYL